MILWIMERLCVREWSMTNPLANDWLANSGFIETRRGPEDVSYQMLGLTHEGRLWHDPAVVKHG